MASSNNDYFSTSRPAIRTRAPSSGLTGAAAVAAAAAVSPGSPRTPLLGRRISSQFGSPSAFRAEQEEHIIYELGARHFSAGFAGESRPRCTVHFDPESGRRVGDYRAFDPGYSRKRRKVRSEEDCGAEHELYRVDLRNIDLGLVEDRLERALRTAHVEYLQLDQKPKKAVLVVPSLLPTPLLEIGLKVLFNHYAQPPSVQIMTTPVLACVSAGLRHGLVVDVGWEETVVTAVGEYKEVCQRRSVRAGKRLTWAMAKVLDEEASNQHIHQESASETHSAAEVSFEFADEVTQRMGWCRPRAEDANDDEYSGMVNIPTSDSKSQSKIHLPFTRLSKPAETTFFTSSESAIGGDDDHDLPLDKLSYNVLLALPTDLRAVCISRIVLTGGVSRLPGLKQRLLQEVTHLVETRGWDPVSNYGTATSRHERVLRERSANIPHRPVSQRAHANPALTPAPSSPTIPLSPAKKPIQDAIPHGERIHDDKYEPLTLRAEKEASRGKPAEMVKGVVRGVETLGAWAGASLVVGMRVKARVEVEREDFIKHGFREQGNVVM